MTKKWIGNLEGSLIDGRCNKIFIKELLGRRIVFNNLEAIKEIVETIPFYAFGMANNHLLDACGVETSFFNLSSLQIPSFGSGRNLNEAKRPLLLEDNGIRYVLYAFGSRDINCIDASMTGEGSNPYNKWNVLEQMKDALKKYPDRRIVAFMHWNIELELYPQPLDRELCHRLIDMGVFAVIGCHAHRPQGYEIYKGRPIVYGLGNFAFMQNTYMAGRLRFPEFSYEELLFEIADNNFSVHECMYNPLSHEITYKGKMKVFDSDAPYADLNKEEYKEFFKKNRIQRKGIPVYYYDDSRFVCNCKYRYGKFRGKMIGFIVGNERLFTLLKLVASKIFK